MLQVGAKEINNQQKLVLFVIQQEGYIKIINILEGKKIKSRNPEIICLNFP